jgi:DNA polymerase-3 subunit epsilon
MLQRWRHARRCRKLALQSTNDTLAQYLDACSTLKCRHIDDTPLISVDLELTGLDSKKDSIIAIGWTLIDGGRMQMGSNRHMLINSGQSVGSSAAIHELMDNEVEQGETLEDGLEALFRAARGRLWVFHHAGLDIAFLKKACVGWAGVVPGFIVLDTLRIEYMQRRRRDVVVKQGDLQLNNIRRLYGLPRYTAHNALIDACATAELMLAIASRLEPDAPLALGPHLKFF